MLMKFKEFDEGVYVFNSVAGKMKHAPSLTDIHNQVKLVLEEAQETMTASDQSDIKGILDGFCDVLVTAVGLGHILQMYGVDVNSAMVKVYKNNLTKFIPNTDEGNEIVKQTMDYYNNKGVQCYAEYNGFGNWWIIKNTNNKVLKPVNYKSVDISDCVGD